MPPAPASTLSVLASTLSVLAAALAVLVAVSTGQATAAPGGGPVVVQPTQALAILLGSHTAMSAPDERSAAPATAGRGAPDHR